jgi:hypothetical protein
MIPWIAKDAEKSKTDHARYSTLLTTVAERLLPISMNGWLV